MKDANAMADQYALHVLRHVVSALTAVARNDVCEALAHVKDGRSDMYQWQKLLAKRCEQSIALEWEETEDASERKASR